MVYSSLRPPLWNSAPLTFSLVHFPPSPPTPLPCVNKNRGMYFTVFNRGGVESGCVESIYRSYTLCIWPDSEPTQSLFHPKPKPTRGGGPHTDKHLKKIRHLGLESVSYLVGRITRCVLPYIGICRSWTAANKKIMRKIAKIKRAIIIFIFYKLALEANSARWIFHIFIALRSKISKLEWY
jgi:hypothetical protein